ncbi:uncharacterized protein GBIM_16555, partial [Gryllus bimaculatus]
FVGPTCEQSVCNNNPCQFGATCAPFPGSGFVCLCPLGKHGLLCEHDLDIAQASFSASVGGLASFMAYPLPAPLHHSLELRFRFRPATAEQVALLAFVGQEGAHDAHADHLAVSFIKGYVVLTWNLGSGGHESANFSLLPHDLPLHTGFAGCLFDVELRAGRSAVALGRTRPAAGRGVGQCGTAECHEHACQHGGACLAQGASFTWSCGRQSERAALVGSAGGWGPAGRRGRGRPRAGHARAFLSLSMQGGVLELRLSSGAGAAGGAGRGAWEPLVLRSGRVLALGRWHRVLAGRYGRRVFLRVDGSVSSALLPPAHAPAPPGDLLYLGGVPDLSWLPAGALAGPATSLRGCVRRLALNWERVPLDAASLRAGRNLADCDGTACGGDACDHGGTCRLNATGAAACSCPPVTVSVAAPQFGGDGYLVVRPPQQLQQMPTSQPQQAPTPALNISFLYLNFSTTQPDGMLLWTARLGWARRGGAGAEQGAGEALVLPGAPSLADGAWHALAARLGPSALELWLDGRLALARPRPAPTLPLPLASDGAFYLGGLPEGQEVQAATGGLFAAGFSGCVGELAWSNDTVITNFSLYEGENVASCDFTEP